ncbi:MAG: hypothetical protein KatS3mg076_2645 [Candidatus Binatia bacterium]|nr:MAG: hypothetical protein KatS3mg076_2645 [Candidatus Binatia bacterium]
MVERKVSARKRGRYRARVWSVGMVASLWALSAFGADYVVTTTADFLDNTDNQCSLREAIQEANDGPDTDCAGSPSNGDDTITFSVSGTIVLGSTLPDIADAGTAGKLTIDGSGQTITISGNNSVLVMRVNSGADLTLRNLSIAEGSADFGGGIRNDGTLTIMSATLSGNVAGDFIALVGGGGGIFNAGWASVINSTFSDNKGVRGAGILNVGTLTIINSTFSGNNAPTTGGGIRNEGTLTLKNTIVANSPSGGNCSGTITDGGGNLSWPDATCPGINQDPTLGPLENNGGPTQTHALLAGSAAIDAVTDCTDTSGNTISTDQRGISRPQPAGGQCDAGAYEFRRIEDDTGDRACSDGSDNDSDGRTDCADPDCATSVRCAAPMPATGWGRKVLLVTLLAALGIHALSLRLAARQQG